METKAPQQTTYIRIERHLLQGGSEVSTLAGVPDAGAYEGP